MAYKAKTGGVKRSGDFYVNKYGVQIPVQEVEQFRKNVEAINKRAQRQLKKFGQLEREIDNRKTGQKITQLIAMGYEPEMLYAKRSANLNQFQSKEQFSKRLKSTQQALKPTYIDERVREYKRNYTKALIETYGEEAKPLVNKIRSMKRDEFMRKTIVNPDQLSIRSIYSQNGNNAANLYDLAEAWGAKKAAAEYEQVLDI